MKKIVSLILTIVLIMCAFGGCGKNGNSGIKIGLAAPDETHGWVAGVSYYAEKYCKENGIEYNLTYSADKEEMSQNINSLIEWGAQAIVVWPQWSGMEDTVDEVIKQGIPVVSFDVDIDCNGIYKVTGNNYDMGYKSAEYIVGKAGEKANIAVLEVPSSGSVSSLRKEGFYDYLKEIDYETENIFEISLDAFSRDCGYNDMKKLLEQYEQIDAVFSMDDEVSIGVLNAIKESGREDIKAITGGGGMQEYFNLMTDAENAKYGLCSALYSPSMIEDAIKTAISVSQSKASSSVVVIPTTIVTAKNVGEFIDAQNTVY